MSYSVQVLKYEKALLEKCLFSWGDNFLDKKKELSRRIQELERDIAVLEK